MFHVIIINMASANTYMGQKGYSIYKNSISIEEQQYIRETLTVQPYTPKASVKANPFPIYRESQQKLYVPRYFGENTYGKPNEFKISEGNNINIDFAGDLRDYQKNIVDVYVKSTKTSSGGLLEIPCGRGKTVIALNIISQLKKKALVIVHKGFLLNQWIERIEQFLPNARVGKIQGPVVDIENKDIVIGMLQSLSMKEYPADLFNSFGLTIVDECHHISSEVFVRSLFTVLTKYTLGLSATMQRKDGLTKVFKMFLGDIIYSEKREQTDGVLVKAIEYKVDDDEFNDVVYDYRGNPLYSTMITKLCKYNRRTEFMLKVIDNMIKENSNQQMLVLSQNKNLLTYMYDAINNRNIASVGYYVGGMKEAALKLSEEKKIILATYAMASEALDIKSLTTLIMATPKTDITQSVGRILRMKHAQPVIVDFIDQQQLFKNQWQKRRTFYIKNKYKIIRSSNHVYDDNNWETIYDPASSPDKTEKRNKKMKSEDTPLLSGKCLVKL